MNSAKAELWSCIIETNILPHIVIGLTLFTSFRKGLWVMISESLHIFPSF